MGQNDLFGKEQELLDRAKALLESHKSEGCVTIEDFQALATAYSELLKQSSQLTRLSDKQQKRMNTLMDRLSRYVPPPIYKKITSGKEKVETGTTRRVKLSIFFSDIKGFSWHSTKMEGEALTAILNSYLEEMTHIIFKHGGTLDKYIGDAIVVFFGDPDFSSDAEHARRAVMMALEMRQRMTELQHKWFELGFPEPLHIRMGISTGFVNVGNFGSSEHMDYTVIGAPVNMAARLQAEAAEDQILISHETWSFVKDVLDCTEGRYYDLKGFYNPVLAYEVKGLKLQSPERQRVIEDDSSGIYLRYDPQKLSRDTLLDIIHKLENDLSGDPSIE